MTLHGGGERIQIYCHQHGTLHEITAVHAEKLLYQYQYRIAEAATSQALPQNNPLTETDYVAANGFCPVADYRMKQTPGWKKFIEKSVAKKREILKMEAQTKNRKIKQQNRR